MLELPRAGEKPSQHILKYILNMQRALERQKTGATNSPVYGTRSPKLSSMAQAVTVIAMELREEGH
jgi:hypothetical protein